AEYNTSPHTSLYAGWSQAYRPVIFQDVIPATVFDVSDDNLKDADGYNLEIGYRGNAGNLRWDISAFTLQYNNRAGTLAGDATGTGSYYILRTTIGDATTTGLEIFAEYPLLQNKHWTVTAFTSTALFHSEYSDAQVRVGNENVSIN